MASKTAKVHQLLTPDCDESSEKASTFARRGGRERKIVDFFLKSFEKVSVLSARQYPGNTSELRGSGGRCWGRRGEILRKGNQQSGHKRQRKMEATFLRFVFISRVSIY